MKKISSLLIAFLLPLMAFAQLKVDSLGNVGINDTIFDNTKFSIISTDSYATKIDALKTGLDINISQGGYNGTRIGLRNYCQVNTSNMVFGLYSITNNKKTSYTSNNRSIAVMGSATGVANSYKNFGVSGSVNANNGAGIYGTVSNVVGSDVVGQFAGYFEGNVKVTGTINGTVISPSDMRLKENVEEISTTRGGTLSSLSLLTPITYNYKDEVALYSQREKTKEDFEKETEITVEDSMLIEEENVEVKPNPILLKKHYGFSAQELQKIYPDLVYENDNGYLSVNYIELVPILVQAINELNEEVESLRSGHVAMSKPMLTDDNDAGDMTAIDEVEAITDIASMSQNMPNPFSEKTDIAIYLPESTQKAILYIYDLSGKQLEQYEVEGRGETTMTIHADKMDAGMYVYSLIADGKVVTTKKMIVTK